MSATAVEGLVIGGERVAAAEGASFDVTNPATGMRLATVADAGAEDVDRAVAAAAGAFEVWGALSPVTRGRHMHRFADAGRGTTPTSWRCSSAATSACRSATPAAQLGMIVDVMRYYAGAVDKFFGHTIPVERDGRRADVPRADRRRRADHALELPAQHRQLEDRAGARGREHGRPQAGIADAALGAALRRARRRGRAPGGCAERRPRPRRDGRRTRSSSIRSSARSASPGRPRSASRSPGGPPRRSSGSRSSSAASRPASSSPTPISRRWAGMAPYAVFENCGQDCCARSRLHRRGVGEGRGGRALRRDDAATCASACRRTPTPRSGR